jgi:heme-degrading monooxygenase HmoA
MFARVITAQAGADGFRQRHPSCPRTASGARQQPGFKGFYLLTETETGTIMTISLWETRDQMEAVEAQAVLYRRSLQMSDPGCE